MVTPFLPMRALADRLNSLRLPLLLAAAVLVWLWATGLWSAAAWRVPAAYSIDALETLARLRIASDKGLAFLVDKSLPQLGAPWGADWSAYPMPDAPAFILFGWLAGFIGLIPASNLALLGAHLAAVATFFLCSRALGHRSLFAGGAALLFGFCFYNLHRGLSHYSFALTYVVPAQLLCAWVIGGGRRTIARRRWQVFCLATAFATGFGNPYFGFGFGLLLTAALAWHAATGARRLNLVVGAACLAVLAVTLLLFNASAIVALLASHASVLERNFASTELYGLRPIELFIPPPFHRWSFAAALGRHYAAATSLKGELFAPYLGLAGVAGLLVIGLTAARRLLRGRGGLRPAYAATVLFLTAFFVVGGANSALALAGLDLFRAGNRYSIYLLALALLALASWASRRGRRLGPAATCCLMVPAVAIGLWDQVPAPRAPADRAALSRKVADDRRIAALLQSALPPGAAVFQLPVVPFLEQPPVNAMTDYELFRPWLYSPRIRFSYGLLAGDPALRWQKWVAAQPAKTMCAALERAGYAALYLHKAAFADGGADWQRRLGELGKSLLIEASDQIVYSLAPAGATVAPDLADARLADAWSPAVVAEDLPSLYASEGWFAFERDARDSWRWAGSAATLAVWCPGDSPRTVRLEFSFAALQAAGLTAAISGREIWHGVASEAPSPPVSLDLALQPGANRIEFTYAGQLVRPSAADARRLGFRLANVRVDFGRGR